jgi:hypothetical protein
LEKDSAHGIFLSAALFTKTTFSKGFLSINKFRGQITFMLELVRRKPDSIMLAMKGSNDRNI